MANSSKKNILFIGNYPPPYGGVPRHFEYLMPHLIKQNWSIHVLSGGNSGIKKQADLTVYKPTQWQRYFSFTRQLFHQPNHPVFQQLKKVARPDWLRYITYIEMGRHIIEQHNIQLISAFNMYSYAPIGAYLSEAYNIPLIVTNFGEFYSHKTFFQKNPNLTQYVCERSTKLLAMSKHCADSYSEIGLKPNVTVIPYGVDIKMFKPDNNGDIIRKRFNLTPTDLVVLFVGRLCHDMGLSTLLEAINQLVLNKPSIKYIIAGESGDATKAVQQLSEKYLKRVFFTTCIPFDELPLFYAAASIVVAPTQGARACGSLAAIEAMSTGKPVIAAQVGGIPEIIQHNITGQLVEANNSAMLAENIAKLSELSPVKLNAMGTAARQRVVTIYDESKLDQQFEQFYNSLLVPHED
ncbi:MAG: glycosyltransferase family 4 protein [Patescibacteria group bacterium]|jgi:glycosyltransferase involved in cell wall biosynthesis